MTDYIAADLQALAVELSTLTPDDDNPIAHTEDDLEQTRLSLVENGQVEPVIYNRSDHNRIIHGNARYQAALALGWSHIAAIGLELAPDMARRLSIALNATGRRARWDDKTLAAQIKRLELEANPVPGLTDQDLSAILADALLADSVANVQSGDRQAAGDQIKNGIKGDGRPRLKAVIYAEEVARNGRSGPAQ